MHQPPQQTGESASSDFVLAVKRLPWSDRPTDRPTEHDHPNDRPTDRPTNLPPDRATGIANSASFEPERQACAGKVLESGKVCRAQVEVKAYDWIVWIESAIGRLAPAVESVVGSQLSPFNTIQGDSSLARISPDCKAQVGESVKLQLNQS